MSRRSSLDLFEFRPRQIMSEFVWKKMKYTRKHVNEPDYIRRVMVIYAGGTLGMKYDQKQGERVDITLSLLGFSVFFEAVWHRRHSRVVLRWGVTCPR